jgi:hypothetical protein
VKLPQRSFTAAPCPRRWYSSATSFETLALKEE